MTRQRRVLLEELRSLRNHPTADELHQRLRVQLPTISLGTVYRNLDMLCRGGQVRRLETGQGPARYDGELRPHYHLRCEGCGRLEDVDVALVREPGFPGTSPGGFEITGCQVELLGRCPWCRQAAQVPENDAPPGAAQGEHDPC